MPSSSEIAGQIAALDAAVVAWEIEMADLSLAAVAGDEEARKSLAELLTKLNGASADRVILASAHDAAIRTEAEAARADRAERMTQNMETARTAAIALAEASNRFDTLTGDLLAALVEIEDAEGRIWKALTAAGETPGDAVLGRRGLASEAASHLAARLQGKRLERTLVGNVNPTVRTAWSFLFKKKAA